MRHGLAVDQFESDFTRALSTTGEKQIESVLQQLLESSSERPTFMLVSPFARTQSTAKIAHKKLALNQPFETEDLLVHFADYKLLGDFLLACEHENLMIVSHMPIVAQLCQYLSPGCEVFSFQTAQCVRMDFERINNVSVDEPVNGFVVQSITSSI